MSGDSWSAKAEEVHDLRRSYGIKDAFHFPVNVFYTYAGNKMINGVKIAILKIQYETFHNVKYSKLQTGLVPVKIMGVSKQAYYWDIKAGKLHSYRENFDYIFYLSNGTSVEYIGEAEDILIKSEKMDKKKMAADLSRKFKNDKIKDTYIKKNKNGVTIVMENIQFQPNSAELTDREKKKLGRISGILKNITGRDFLITGHTARVGPEKTSQKLSERRAVSVADYLLHAGACKKRQITTVGKGSRVPVSDNSTEKGRRRNRRVEITILDN